MLLTILRMPPIFGIPTDRRLLIHAGINPPPYNEIPFVHWPTVPLYHEDVVVGTNLTIEPKNIYKTIHVSRDGLWIFETVFAMERDICSCLYTKVITPVDIGIAIPLNSVAYYQNSSSHLLPVSHFMATQGVSVEDHYNAIQSYSIDPHESIVPLIFDETTLWRYLDSLAEAKFHGAIDNRSKQLYRPIYEKEPLLFEALSQGYFNKPPFNELVYDHSGFTVGPDKWFGYEELEYTVAVKNGVRFTNHPAFNAIAVMMIQMFPSKLSVTSSFEHAVDDIRELWTTRHYEDPYQINLRGLMVDEVSYKQKMATIFHLCVKLYCQLFNIDLAIYTADRTKQAYVTVNKNIYDEVSVVFNDPLHDKLIYFYTSFPTLALSTLAVGSYY